ncbi:MAG: single-stranded-DNA-specific exonuclease RecJ [Clostridia bacterium]|nr:single-stranded-DNA-specific exonuclease RecJ [Clostridia bacterium]
MKSNKIWNIIAKTEDSSIINEMSSKIGISRILATLIVNRGYRDVNSAKDFIRKGQEVIHNSFLLNDIDKAIERVLKAVDTKEKITIYGDFDVDGVTSVCILKLYLEKIGGIVDYYIPNRKLEGYGVSTEAIDTLRKNNTNLMITVDTGVTAIDEIDYANKLGIDTIVTDHHECSDVLPNAVAVINPKRKDSTYPFQYLAGVGVVFKFLCALESVRAGIDIWDATRKIAYDYSDLTAIGTIADVMPVIDENRIIISIGLARAEKTDKVGLSTLIDICSNGEGKSYKAKTKRKINSNFVGYTLSPRINAAGRISSANIAANLFLEKDKQKAYDYVLELCEINRERQATENRIADTAYEIIENNGYIGKSIFVLDNNDWHNGVIGIVSARVSERYGVPSILISFEGNDDPNSPEAVGKGSGRSLGGLNLVEALNSCSDILEKYGGHELAAGLTIKRKHIEEFRARMEKFATNSFDGTEPVRLLDIDCEISSCDVNVNLAREISCLEPCGASNPTPTFMLRNVVIKDIVPVGMNRHLRLTLSKDGYDYTAMFFSVSPQDFMFSRGDEVDVAFNLEINEFNGITNAQISLKDVKLSERNVHFEKINEELFQNTKMGVSDLAYDYVVPSRDDCMKVYNFLNQSSRVGKNNYRYLRLLSDLSNESSLNYVKIKFIISIFRELNIVNIDFIDDYSFSFRFSYPKVKANLEKSNILKKLKQQFK